MLYHFNLYHGDLCSDLWKSDPHFRPAVFNYLIKQHSTVSDSPGLVDFAIGLVNFVLNLPDGQVNFFEEFKLQKNFEINYSAHQNVFGVS